MIYWLMAGSIALLSFATYSTYKDYTKGKLARAVFTRMRLINVLMAVAFVIMLLGRIVL